METPIVTPLRKHRGQHGGLIALLVLVATVTVVWTTRPRSPAPAPPPVAAQQVKPMATAVPLASTVPRPPERVPLTAVALDDRIQTATVGERELQRIVTATGAVTYDEDRTAHVTAPVSGWLKKTRAKSVGRPIRAGETLGVIYSPEVYLATQDVIEQVRNFKTQDLLDRSRVRLLRWGMRRDALAKIEITMKPQAALPLIARVNGTMLAEQGPAEGLVDPSQGELFTVSDPAYAWVYVDMPVAAATRAKLGMPARLAIAGLAQPLPGTIGYISRRVDEGMKTVRFDIVRAMRRPPINAAVKVELALASERGPAVPSTAVRRDGEQPVVYVVRGKLAEPREVGLGPEKAGFVLIDHGIKTGDVVAVDIRQLPGAKPR